MTRPSPFPFGRAIGYRRPGRLMRRGMGDDTSDDGSDDFGDLTDDGSGDMLGSAVLDDGSSDPFPIITDDGSGDLGTLQNGVIDGVDLSSVQNYATTATSSSTGTGTLGSITSFLQSNGLNLGQVANVIATALQQPNNTAAQQAYLQQELAFAQAQTVAKSTTSTTTLLIVAAAAVGIFLIARK